MAPGTNQPETAEKEKDGEKVADQGADKAIEPTPMTIEEGTITLDGIGLERSKLRL